MKIIGKVGSNVVTDKNEISVVFREKIVPVLAKMKREMKNDLLLVSSGAVKLGNGRERFFEDEIRQSQAAASIGGRKLFDFYAREFEKYGIISIDVLLSNHDLHKNYEGFLRETLVDFMGHSDIFPIVNTNDVTDIHELREFLKKNGDENIAADNDNLAAKIAVLTRADLLILGTFGSFRGQTTRGVIDKDSKQLISEICGHDDLQHLINSVSHEKSEGGTGGMAEKLKAAKFAVKNGVKKVVICDGRDARAWVAAAEGENYDFTQILA